MKQQHHLRLQRCCLRNVVPLIRLLASCILLSRAGMPTSAFPILSLQLPNNYIQPPFGGHHRDESARIVSGKSHNFGDTREPLQQLYYGNSKSTPSLHQYLSLYLLVGDDTSIFNHGSNDDSNDGASMGAAADRVSAEVMSISSINTPTRVSTSSVTVSNANTESTTSTSTNTNANANTNVNYSWEKELRSLKKDKDEVVRVLDANTIKLKKNGLVTFAAVQTPSGYNNSNFRFPDCFTKSPSTKVRRLLPSGTKVFVRFVDTDNGSGRPRSALVELESRSLLINSELVREGFAKPVGKGRLKAEELLPGLSKDLVRLQEDARERKVGMFQSCDDIENIASDDQFEPLDVTTETRWGDDGGKLMLKPKEIVSSDPPPNPGDKRGCSDFRSYEDALRWYETFYPYYGDVARLDRDGDGIPCSGLPHTPDSAKYRVKKPVFTNK